MGYRFRRQHPIGPFFADFACVECRLIVELDGGQHGEQRAADEQRTAYVRGLGWRVIRFWDDEVLMDTGLVLEEILRQLAPPSP